MRHTNRTLPILTGSLIIATVSLSGGVRLQLRDGRPVVDGVYVNGHGPYRFLVDTGANINLIETGIARKIGMAATLQADLASAAVRTRVAGSDGNEVALDSVKAAGQRFLYSALDAVHYFARDVQGVLGQWFLARFDYTIDLRRRQLEFGKRDLSGTRIPLKMVKGRPVVSTNLGDLALDSGADRLTLFGVRPDPGTGFGRELRTLAGAQHVGMVSGKPLLIAGRKISDGPALAIPDRSEPGVNGLLPLSLLRAVYFCNSEGFVIFE